uniref:Uncharacterized protein n=1 Tax=Electric ant polycipivirus 1 TaxID=3003605 RepID=A0AA95IYY3_9VIRU|nr:hypothetical protein [Electric ant polycipivirus 1]
MNAVNPTGSFSSRAAGNFPSVLSDSGVPGGFRTLGSNYYSNLTLGNNLGGAQASGGAVFSSTTSSSFASEAQKTRSLWESGMADLKNQSVTNPIDTATNIAEGASALASTGLAASGIGAPLGLAMQLSQAVGRSIQGSLSTSAQNTIGRDYQNNLQQWSIGGNKAADAVYNLQQQRAADANTGAAFGSIFGPFGALAGWWIGMQSSSANDPYNAYKVNSFGGGISASDSGIAPSLNSDATTGESTMTDSL